MEKQIGKWPPVALAIILTIGLGLHLYRLSYPNRPVFDEAHFATYAADYVKDKVFFDIHPPLGKLIYAAFIPITHSGPFGDTTFVAFTKNATGTVYYPTNIPYGSFPYVPLRLVGVFFGLALTVAFYFFLRNIGVSEVGALLGAFFATFENALLLETRLILMNGMYLAFGFTALALWFKKSKVESGKWKVAAGFFLGLSLGVKLIGIVFIGPILLSPVIPRHQPRDPGSRKDSSLSLRNDIRKFLITAALIFIIISSLNFLFFSPSQILSFSESIGMKFPPAKNAAGTALLAYGASTIVPWAEYVIGGPQPQTSPWYLWPFTRGSMTYYATPSGTGNLILTGNPLIWYGSTLAVIIGILFLISKFRNFEISKQKAALILLSGYFFSLLPFFTIVRRGTFLYHYFPALLFAMGLLAYGVSRWLKLETLDLLTKRQWFWLVGIAAVTIAGFILTAPLTYGL